MASLNHPSNLKYSKTDEWIRLEGDHAVIGITDYAQDQLGDIVYIEMPWTPDQTISSEEKFGDIESVKATSELLSPISGNIVKVNDVLKDRPEFINDDPYDQGWMLEVKVTHPSELDSLMSIEQYMEYIQDR